MKNVLEVIAQQKPKMSHAAQSLASYILENYKEVANMDISTLAHLASVSNATVTRFATDLGLEGFPQLRYELQKVIFNYYTSADEIQDFMRRSDLSSIRDVDEALKSVASEYESIDKTDIKRAAKLIYDSSQVFVIGNQISSVFIPFTMYFLSKYKKGLNDVSSLSLDDERAISAHDEKCCAIVFAMQRYPNKTMAALQKLKECNVPMIIITDSDLFPYEDLTEVTMHVAYRNPLAFTPVMITYGIIYDVILNVIALDVNAASDNVAEFDDFVERNNIYFKTIKG